MKPIVLTQGALGFTAWAPINQIQNAFGIGLGCSVTSGANLTYSVQHTFDDPSADRQHTVAITRAATVATVVDADHRLSVNDEIKVTGSGDPNLDGDFAVASVVDANTYTYTVANTGLTTANINVKLISFRVYNHAVIVGQTGRIDGNYAFSIQAIRLIVTAYVSGKVDLTILQGMGR